MRPSCGGEKVIDKAFVSCYATTGGPQSINRLLFFSPLKNLVFCNHNIMNVISAEASPYQPIECIIKLLTSPYPLLDHKFCQYCSVSKVSWPVTLVLIKYCIFGRR